LNNKCIFNSQIITPLHVFDTIVSFSGSS